MKPQQRLGIFGGSFDPVHAGHIRLALAAQKEFKLDRIIFVPARQPPHKKKRRLTPAAGRLRLLQEAVRPYPGFTISRYEVRRARTTYTYQTLRYFKNRFPGAALFFIIGSDSLAELSTWKHSESLAKLCTFVVGRRPGARAEVPAFLAQSVRLLKKPMPAVSSSEVRQTAAGGHSIARLVPRVVARTIAKRGLYRVVEK